MQNFSELMFSRWFSRFFRIIKAYQYFFTFKYIINDVSRGLGRQKNILLDTIYIIFFP